MVDPGGGRGEVEMIKVQGHVVAMIGAIEVIKVSLVKELVAVQVVHPGAQQEEYRGGDGAEEKGLSVDEQQGLPP